MEEKRKRIPFLSEFSGNLKFVIVVSFVCGLIIGIARGNSIIHANQYLQNSLYYVSVWILQNSIINSIASMFVILIFVALVMTLGEKGLFVDFLLLSFLYLLLLITDLELNLIITSHPLSFLLLTTGLCGIIFVLHINKNLKKIIIFFDKLISWGSVLILGGLIVIAFVIYNRSIYSLRNINCAEGPNIILISIDSLRADHLSCYGYQRNTSPNIDRLAREGTIFKNCFSQATSTLPSHASIFLSQYVWKHKVNEIKTRLSDSSTVLPEILKNENYVTAAFTGAVLVSTKFGFNQGFDVYQDGIPGTKTRHEISCYINKLLNWLESVRNKKFFLFIHTNDVHGPYNPPPPYVNLYTKRHYEKEHLWTAEGIVPAKLDGLELTPEEIDFVMAVYDGGINYVDYQLGKLFEKLSQLGIDDNTVIIITSDHGEAFREHGRLNHGHKPYIEEVHVPLIIKGPGIPRNMICDNYVQHIDMVPTILEILNIPQRKEMQGKSLLSLMKISGIQEQAKTYSWGLPQWPFSISLRTKEWTYIMNQNGPDELYDRIDDPKEQNNIIEKRRVVAQGLKQELEDFIALTSEEKSQVAEKAHIDEQLKERLKSLGYLH